MTSSLRRQLIKLGTPIALLALAIWQTWTDSHQAVTPALLIFAVFAANRTDVRGALTFVTLIATACLALPLLISATLPSSEQSLLFACLWGAAALVNWQSGQVKLDSDGLEHSVQHQPTGLLVTDLTGKIVSAEETIAQTLRAKQSELIGSPLPSRLRDVLWPLIEQNAQALAEGETLEAEFEYEADGARRIFQAYGKLAKGKWGRPKFYTFQISDLTDRRAEQATIEQSNNQFQNILAHSAEAIFVLNRKLCITFANQAARSLFVGEPSALIGQQFYDLIEPEHQRLFMRSLEALQHTPQRKVSIASLTFRHLRETNAATRLVQIRSANGPTYAVICTAAHAEAQTPANTGLSRPHFSQAFHHNPEAMLILRARDGVVVECNEGFTHLLGYTREAAMGGSEVDLQLWADADERTTFLERLDNNHEVLDYETRLRSRSGSLVHAEISVRYLEIDGERSVLCLGRDISKRLSSAATLIDVEKKFEKAFSENPDGMIILRQTDGAITDLNQAFVDWSDYSRHDCIGQRFSQFLPDDARAEFDSRIETLGGEGHFANLEISLVNHTGDRLPALISGSTFELDSELYTMLIAKDIGKQQAIEDQLSRSEQRFRGIFENTPIGILLVDLDGRILQANQTAETLLAYDEQQMSGLHISRLVPSSDRSDLKQLLESLSFNESPAEKSQRKLICQNDIEIWANVNILLQRDREGLPSSLIVQIADITDIKTSRERMEQMAFYDTLTKLANRRLFQDRLTQAIEATTRHHRSAALLYLDLDNFKRVNDTLGHDAGDFLLREVAERLRNCVRKEDTVGRPGGDEFTILLNEISSPSDAGLVAQKILNRLSEPLNLDGHPLVITTSIGITTLPGDGTDPNSLMRNADLAMYKAKERGRNNYQFYSRDLNEDAIERLRTEYEIRLALEHNQFQLYYQPKISLKTMQIVGFESLIRWNHPERGLLGPRDFIEIAEETGSIIDIGNWVIEEACRASQMLNAGSDRPINMAINISARQFRDPNLVNTLQTSLRAMRLEPSTLELEVTETTLMQDAEAAKTTVNRFSDLGVRVSIDDFGTGFSSLSYLKRFPINTVKIDRTFVSGLPENKDDLAISRAVIAMAHQLNMAVVAEGVETVQQLQCLGAEDCEYAQGYLFSKPISLKETRMLLREDPSLAYGR